MKVILKNSSLVFQSKDREEVELTSYNSAFVTKTGRIFSQNSTKCYYTTEVTSGRIHLSVSNLGYSNAAFIAFYNSTDIAAIAAQTDPTELISVIKTTGASPYSYDDYIDVPAGTRLIVINKGTIEKMLS